MSFGYSVGDFVTLGLLAWKIYKSCKDAPESFRNISQEVLSLHAVLKEAEETFSNQNLSASKQSRLKIIGDGCRGVLQDLQRVVDHYNSLGTSSKRTWDRLGWGTNDIAELRSRLTSNMVMLTAFISTSQTVVEKKLDVFLQEFQDGKHEDERQTWRVIRKELEDIGISVAAFDANKTFIINWFKTAMNMGAFEERGLEDDSGSVSWENNLGPSSEDPEHGPDLASTALDHQKPTPPAIANFQKRRSSRVPTWIQWLLRYDKALVEAAAEGDEVQVRRLLGVGTNIEALNRSGRSVLVMAARNGHDTILRLLLNGGADVNKKDKHQSSALHLAAGQGHETTVRLLLNEGADVNAMNEDKNSALHFAVIQGHETTVRLLLNEGADVNAMDEDKNSTLHVAVIRGHQTIVRLLLNEGADVNAMNEDRNSALHLAVVLGHETTVRLLLNEGADVNAMNGDDNSALHFAAECGHEAIVRLLLEKGANFEAINTHGQTARDMTSSWRDKVTAKLLKAASRQAIASRT